MSRATLNVQLLLALAAYSPYPTERLGLELLCDDRFLKQGAALWELLQGELAYLHHLPFLVWSTVSMLVSENTCPMQLRGALLAAPACGKAASNSCPCPRPLSPARCVGEHRFARFSGVGPDCPQCPGHPGQGLPRHWRLRGAVGALVRSYDGWAGQGQHSLRGTPSMQSCEQLQEPVLRARSTIHQRRGRIRPWRASEVEELEIGAVCNSARSAPCAACCPTRRWRLPWATRESGPGHGRVATA